MFCPLLTMGNTVHLKQAVSREATETIRDKFTDNEGT